MNLGIIGLGVVGSAIRHGFETLGHDVFVHDLKLETNVQDILNTEICYICVPTPYQDDSPDNSYVVDSVIEDLVKLNYSGIIAIKSTILPGSTENFQSKYPSNKICFVPEFLRERCAEDDFISNHDVCVVGTEDSEIFEAIKISHGNFPEVFVQTTPTEAEFIKYFNNTFAAALITYANSFYEVCKRVGANYDIVRSAIMHRSFMPTHYLDCDETLRGFGGPCLPKDTKAFNSLIKSLNLDIDFFDTLLKENSKYKTTVFKGMRGE